MFLQPYIYKTLSARGPAAIERKAPSINMHALLRWLAHMQGRGIELGGFKGRTNKLVDGCYSWWVGGCFPLVDGLLDAGASAATRELSSEKAPQTESTPAPTEDSEWHDVDGKCVSPSSASLSVIVCV